MILTHCRDIIVKNANGLLRYSIPLYLPAEKILWQAESLVLEVKAPLPSYIPVNQKSWFVGEKLITIHEPSLAHQRLSLEHPVLDGISKRLEVGAEQQLR